jgi:response regulator RpfG family c-di-GMP phosphodiesterase
VALGDVLSFFGAVADHAAGEPPEGGERVTALAVAMARLAGLPAAECDALYFAALLRNTGVLGNAAYAKGDPLEERAAVMARWDIPAQGARTCEHIAALPKPVADMVRWQSENWDGMGYPDQLRWAGVPKSAQLLHIAKTYVSSTDADEALACISSESGRTFGPEAARTFVMWFHTFGGEIEPLSPPHHALDESAQTPEDLLAMLADLVDRHNGTPQRAQRIAQRSEDIGRVLRLEEHDLVALKRASQLFGIGELRAAALESQQFDALARLGIETRAAHAMRAASLLARHSFVAEAAPIVRSRAEWYDGTGAPEGLRHADIPAAAAVLSLSIAYDALDDMYRIETAAGTQFDPRTVRALADVLKARA